MQVYIGDGEKLSPSTINIFLIVIMADLRKPGAPSILKVHNRPQSREPI